MRTRGKLRQAGRRLVRHGVHPKNLVLTITDAGGGFALFTTRAPHGLTVSSSHTVVLSGTPGGAYDGTFTVTPGDATSFSESAGVFGGVATGGGTWRLA